MRIHTPLAILLAGLVLTLPAAAQEGKPAGNETKTQDAPVRKKREPIYDEQADARQQIAEALARASKENRRVLIQWGANWCGWCFGLHDTFKNDKKVARKLLYEYDVVLIDIGKWDKNFDLAEKYGAELKGNGVPFLTVLDAEGNVLANQETGSLELPIDENLPGDKRVFGHDPEKVLAFLTEHQAPYLSAESLMADAVKQANEQSKRVFVHYGAPWCPWCHRLEDWLAREDVAEVMGKYFIDLKIDQDRTIGGADLLYAQAQSKRTGIPWSAVLDAEGNVAAPGYMGEMQNIGYPVTDEEIAAFLDMLAKGAGDLSDADREFLAESLRKSRPEGH